jgi:hypothetical protein
VLYEPMLPMPPMLDSWNTCAIESSSWDAVQQTPAACNEIRNVTLNCCDAAINKPVEFKADSKRGD